MCVCVGEAKIFSAAVDPDKIKKLSFTLYSFTIFLAIVINFFARREIENKNHIFFSRSTVISVMISAR